VRFANPRNLREIFYRQLDLILVALCIGRHAAVAVLTGAGGPGLTPVRAVQLINREKAVVIDVCETEEFAAGHVGGAKNVPLGQLEERCPRWSRTRPCR
jgi:predicted sulfurtransferase